MIIQSFALANNTMETSFESNEDNYNSEFVAKIKASEEEEKFGKTICIKTEDLWK